MHNVLLAEPLPIRDPEDVMCGHRYGQSPTLPVRHALQAFTASTSTGTAPPPVPLYIERGPGTAKPERCGIPPKIM